MEFAKRVSTFFQVISFFLFSPFFAFSPLRSPKILYPCRIYRSESDDFHEYNFHAPIFDKSKKLISFFEDENYTDTIVAGGLVAEPGTTGLPKQRWATAGGESNRKRPVHPQGTGNLRQTLSEGGRQVGQGHRQCPGTQRYPLLFPSQVQCPSNHLAPGQGAPCLTSARTGGGTGFV